MDSKFMYQVSVQDKFNPQVKPVNVIVSVEQLSNYIETFASEKNVLIISKLPLYEKVTSIDFSENIADNIPFM